MNVNINYIETQISQRSEKIKKKLRLPISNICYS